MKLNARWLLPNSILQAGRHWLHGQPTPSEAFETIYRDGAWGQSADPTEAFYSGAGSHMPSIVPVYVEAVEKFLGTLERRPDVVDLGCGDFAIGAKVRGLCAGYIACDVVGALIARNRQKHADLDVDFRVLDITAEALPDGDVVFIRQVLQHLSNRQIRAVVDKLQNRYRHVVLTEHLPSTPDFTPNVDKAVGADTRLTLGKNGSGVVLTAAPFNLRVSDTTLLCEVPEPGSVIQTLVYTLPNAPRAR